MYINLLFCLKAPDVRKPINTITYIWIRIWHCLICLLQFDPPAHQLYIHMPHHTEQYWVNEIKNTKQIPWTNSEAWTYKINTRQIRNEYVMFAFVHGASSLGGKITSYHFVIVLQLLCVQACLFVHGSCLVLFISLTKPYSM